MIDENPESLLGKNGDTTTIGRQRRLIRQQRLCIGLLSFAVVGSLIGMRAERHRADRMQLSAMQILGQAGASQASTDDQLPLIRGKHVHMPATDPSHFFGDPAATSQYPVTLIAEDGSTTSLTGKALMIDLGKSQPLYLDLKSNGAAALLMVAPAKREDEHWNRVILHPLAANALFLQLSPVSKQGAAQFPGEKFQFTDSADVSQLQAGDFVADQPESSDSKSR